MEKSRKKKYWNGITVKILCVFALFLIPVYILLFGSVNSYLESLQATAVNAAEAILELNMNDLYAEINSQDRFFYDMQESDTDYIRLCSWSGSSEDYLSLFAVNRLLVNQHALCTYTKAMYSYIENADIFLLATRNMGMEEKEEIRTGLQENGMRDRFVRWQAVTLGGQECLVHTVGYYGVYVGAVIDMDAFREQVREQLGYENAVVTMDTCQELPLEDETITVSCQIPNTDSWLHVTLDKEEISRAMPEIARRTHQYALFSILLIPVLFLTFFRMIVEPLHRIETGLRRLGEGEQDYRIQDFRSSNEFVSLKESFNAMAEEIRTLKIASYEEKLERERMNLSNLLLQIHPHFILNTFNQIFSMAQLKDFQGIQKMSMYLSKYFRYLFGGEHNASIRDEVAIVRDYLEMMERRYLDCFTVEWDMDESLFGCRIPPLVLHNIVENVFKYAVSEGCETSLRISLKKDGECALLTVADDGPGMEPEILEKIQAMEPIDKKDGRHIGIWNCGYRLKTLCGEKADLMIASVLSEGTTVTIRLPCGGIEDDTENG